jgi:hypothetical protein
MKFRIAVGWEDEAVYRRQPVERVGEWRAYYDAEEREGLHVPTLGRA